MPRHLAVHRDGDEEGACRQRRVVAHRAPDALRHETVAAHDDMAPLHPSHDAFASDLSDLGGKGQRKAARLGRGDDGLRDGVFRRLLQRGGEAEDIVVGHAVVAVDRDDLRASARRGAGLVEYKRANARHRLERPAPLIRTPR